ncbi:MAG TPA: lipopolysaccharide transport periplasmic protein LptA [Rhodocyclaceae bacterium]|nr:lipopolysaccharide transport periplasmic protein LptA [Rhodocyclaceae bacterium]HNH34471.1 lipopolysaccharide transport periplasmic protein LptA [Rhodocyclaceae bacterium]
MSTRTRMRRLLAAALILPAGIALAERADRDRPVNLEADRITVDDVRKVHVLEGNVQLTQGTLLIRTARLTVTQDAEGFQKGIAQGGPGGLAYFRQKREGRDEFVEGQSDRIEHDGRAEKTEFFGHAWVKSGLDEVRGEFISYDGKSENYVVTGGPKGTSSATGPRERVRAVIQPKNKDGGRPAAVQAGEAPTLRSAPEITNPRKE